MGALGDKLDELKVRYSTQEVAERWTELNSRGQGRCPFRSHEDRNPSFSVKLMSSGWRFACFGCSRKGDVIDLVGHYLFEDSWNRKDEQHCIAVVEELERVPFTIEKEKKTVQPVSLSLPEPTTRIMSAWSAALGLYGGILHRSEEVQDYLEKRGIVREIQWKYRFGLCPLGREGEKSHLEASLSVLRIKREALFEASLLRKRTDDDGNFKGYYEYFGGRIVFADVDIQRRPLYMVGRMLPGGGLREDSIRYLSVAGFAKPVFGLASLSGSRSKIILVEGQFDKFTLEAWGYDAVAIGGGNPSYAQIKALSGLNSKGRSIVPCMDNDVGGAKALESWRENMPFLSEPLTLPEKVGGIQIKDVNDLIKVPHGEGMKIFDRLAQGRGVKHKRRDRQ